MIMGIMDIWAFLDMPGQVSGWLKMRNLVLSDDFYQVSGQSDQFWRTNSNRATGSTPGGAKNRLHFGFSAYVQKCHFF